MWRQRNARSSTPPWRCCARAASSATLQAIARGADVSLGALQHHFESRDALMERLVIEVMEPLSDQGTVWPDKALPLRERAEAFVTLAWDNIFGAANYQAAWSMFFGCKASPRCSTAWTRAGYMWTACSTPASWTSSPRSRPTIPAPRALRPWPSPSCAAPACWSCSRWASRNARAASMRWSRPSSRQAPLRPAAAPPPEPRSTPRPCAAATAWPPGPGRARPRAGG
ncbi:TetR/AcrR family transcriptional regulator [Delftia tsuruhatensis]